jgi:hypothetical protein
MSIHLSDDQLVDRLYGVSDAGSEHLDACAECQLRWSKVQQRRDLVVAAPALSSQQLRQQRRQILNRLATPTPAIRMMWAPATAALMLIAGLAVTTPKAKAPVRPAQPAIETVEAGWFEDTYSATRQMEPRASSPIRGLFIEGMPE